MANIILHKRSSTPGTVPTSGALSQGELGINIGDGKLYTKNSGNNVINLGVTSISGTSITPSSGNFSNYLAVNGVPVSVSGHSHTSVPQAQSLVTSVFNKTGSSIPKFSVVYIDGGQGDQPTIKLAIASNEAGSSKTYGVTAEAISNMSSGNVVVAGTLTGLNTDQFNPTAPTGNVNGTSLWLSPTVSGSVTTTKPYASNHAVFVGTIVRTHQNAGVVEVRVQNGYELEELHNVAVSGVSGGQFLYYNSSSGLWQPNSNIYSSGSNIGIGTGSPVAKLHVDGDIVQTNNYFDTVNDRKSTTYLLSTTTTYSVTSSELSSNGNKAIKLDTDRTYTFSILVTARQCSPAGLIAGFKLEGIVTDQNGLSTIVGTPVKTVFAKDNVNWDINASITSVGPDNYLTFIAYCPTATSHDTRWVANLLVVEVGTNGTGY